MLSIRDLFIYNLDYEYGDTLIVQFEGSNVKYSITCEDLIKITNYPVYRFHGYEVSLLFNMREEDKQYFKRMVV